MTLDGPVAAALGEARELERRARQLALAGRGARDGGGAQAWVAALERDAARSRSAVLARLEEEDGPGALREARSLVETVRARGVQAYVRTMESVARAAGGEGKA